MSYDDKDDDEKLESIEKYINDVTKGTIKKLAILDHQNNIVKIYTHKKHDDFTDNDIYDMLGHSSYSYMSSEEKDMEIRYNGIDIPVLLENLEADLNAGNFDLEQTEVDKEYYQNLLLKMKE